MPSSVSIEPYFIIPAEKAIPRRKKIEELSNGSGDNVEQGKRKFVRTPLDLFFVNI